VEEPEGERVGFEPGASTTIPFEEPGLGSRRLSPLLRSGSGSNEEEEVIIGGLSRGLSPIDIGPRAPLLDELGKAAVLGPATAAVLMPG